MTDAVIAVGEKIHVVTRRQFTEDLRRHFAGTVVAVNAGLIRAEGSTFIVNQLGNDVKKLNRIRHRIFGLEGGDHIVNIIPSDVEINRLSYQVRAGVLVITDGQTFLLEVNEQV